jgi:hypothetical protein
MDGLKLAPFGAQFLDRFFGQGALAGNAAIGMYHLERVHKLHGGIPT